MCKLRFNVTVTETFNGTRRPPVKVNFDPVRSGKLRDTLLGVVADQYVRLSRSGNPVRGLDLGDTVLLWTSDRLGVVVKVVRA